MPRTFLLFLLRKHAQERNSESRAVATGGTLWVDVNAIDYIMVPSAKIATSVWRTVTAVPMENA